MLVQKVYQRKASDNQKLSQIQGKSLILHTILFPVLKSNGLIVFIDLQGFTRNFLNL